MKFQKWINPKNNEVRVYISGVAEYGISVFVVDGATTGHYEAGFPEIIVRAKGGAFGLLIGQSQIDDISDRIDRFVDENRPEQPSQWVCPKFSDYLSLANA